MKHLLSEYQFYGLSKDGELTFAGIFNLPRLTKVSILRAYRKHQIWKYQYLRNNPGDYPLRFTPATDSINVIHLTTKAESHILV